MSLTITNEKALKSGRYWIHFKCGTKKCGAYGDITSSRKEAVLALFADVAAGHTCDPGSAS